MSGKLNVNNHIFALFFLSSVEIQTKLGRNSTRGKMHLIHEVYSDWMKTANWREIQMQNIFYDSLVLYLIYLPSLPQINCSLEFFCILTSAYLISRLPPVRTLSVISSNLLILSSWKWYSRLITNKISLQIVLRSQSGPKQGVQKGGGGQTYKIHEKSTDERLYVARDVA